MVEPCKVVIVHLSVILILHLNRVTDPVGHQRLRFRVSECATGSASAFAVAGSCSRPAPQDCSNN